MHVQKIEKVEGPTLEVIYSKLIELFGQGFVPVSGVLIQSVEPKYWFTIFLAKPIDPKKVKA